MTVSERFEFDMVSAPVDVVDRRALSEAWYSALYAARNAVQARPVRLVTQSPENPARAGTAGTPRDSAALHATVVSRSAREILPRLAFANERRGPLTPLARVLERSLMRGGQLIRRASFSLGGTDGRVHVVVQGAGSKVRLIAICTPKARDRVAAALTQLRFILASRGFDVQTTLGGQR